MKTYLKNHRLQKSVNKKSIIATVDIGMKLNYGYYKYPNGGGDIKPFEFTNDKAGYDKFRKIVKQRLEAE